MRKNVENTVHSSSCNDAVIFWLVLRLKLSAACGSPLKISHTQNSNVIVNICTLTHKDKQTSRQFHQSIVDKGVFIVNTTTRRYSAFTIKITANRTEAFGFSNAIHIEFSADFLAWNSLWVCIPRGKFKFHFYTARIVSYKIRISNEILHNEWSLWASYEKGANHH